MMMGLMRPRAAIGRLGYAHSSSLVKLRMLSSSSPPERSGLWSNFASTWNETLERRPQEALATYLAAQSTTWLAIYTSLSAATASGLFALSAGSASLAAGWMFARLTKKFRRPFNVVLAAAAVKVMPALSDVKVSPLVTGFVAPDEEARKELKAKRIEMESNIPGLRAVFENVSKGASYLQGPVDKYGLSLFLSGKVSSLGTICVSTYFISKGVDVEALLVEWGINDSGGLSDVAGTLAASSVCNVFFTPLHFWATVRGVPGLEKAARSFVPIINDIKSEKQYGRSSHKRKEKRHQGEEEHFLRAMGMILLFWSFGVSMYALRLIGKKALKDDEYQDGNNKDDNF